MTRRAAVIGGGPAGLMAAEMLGAARVPVTVFEAKPTVARKFLMAGKSGLNLTKDEPLDHLLPHYAEAADALKPMLADFDAEAVQDWARGLGQDLFTGSTGRVFPREMKASPLLRAWLARLEDMGIEIRTRMRWRGWDDAALVFDGPEGGARVTASATVLALGGASWARLGSDGAWRDLLSAKGIPLAPFAPANSGASVAWSEHMRRHFGTPLKGIALSAGRLTSRGEAVLSARGLEGGGVYTVSRGMREGAPLTIDLLPDLDLAEATRRLSRPRGKASLSNHLRKTLGFDAAKIALVQEIARPLPAEAASLARILKALYLPNAGLRPLDEAISTAGGISLDALDGELMLRALPGTYCAGEMLDWEAPTGGYLLTACFASGRWAGRAAARRLNA
ncbi:TIGR03862 family flavoprotein [Sulfitobacter sp. D35]|uniref:TIGR03862 family flavoprotein n=1 Tax=Sulfitobacter sp. D35 TaxID=3083252 RepID=UPI00296F4980|nr:TIGR03862 family flavoprotein [Sulfitobacter sp. D35]MDW4498332.1 TIGR03862 family flavoprotein [Sulfitobacter sp. D35]